MMMNKGETTIGLETFRPIRWLQSTVHSTPSPQSTVHRNSPISSVDFASSSSSSAPTSSVVVDSDHLRLLVALGGMDCSKRSAGAVASLPDDPLVEILSRVPVKSLCRFKCVSKAWRDLIADPLHRKKLPQTLEGFFFLGDRCG
ncbi:uncharacterized protein LOC111256353 [Setaria italica]|uniref:uncharacterized protein LOC111256353 n=1 Tax=Setaria italica TaxID=4555 RepID=UPI000BE5F828|nr:uncharacterized protein LOC111256353 [Setaria italica]XP_034580680.1 uncharacterized protein LOC117844002 [Setaria viridis]